MVLTSNDENKIFFIFRDLYFSFMIAFFTLIKFQIYSSKRKTLYKFINTTDKFIKAWDKFTNTSEKLIKVWEKFINTSEKIIQDFNNASCLMKTNLSTFYQTNAPRFVNKLIKNQDKFIFFRYIQQDLDKNNKTSDKYTKKYHKLEQTHQDIFHRHIFQETLATLQKKFTNLTSEIKL